ncbi:MAG: type II methionyl aminopeptidase [Nanoarchaeota archaeon]
MNTEKIVKAGKIASQVKKFARSFIKPKMPLLDIAEKIEAKIIELGGESAFPVNLSINNIAAHYTPSHDDKSLAHGLLKIDLGVHVDGWIADTAFSMDLENSQENKKLIQASEEALKSAEKILKAGIHMNKIGGIIEKTIKSKGFSPIINLSGHEISQYELHAGVSVPNIDDSRASILTPGLYAIEPFATNGSGKVHDGKPSGIYMLRASQAPRNPGARKLLDFIVKKYNTLPFCSRWIVKKFGAKSLFDLKILENNGNLHHFAQLTESENAIVSQAENTVLIGKEIIVTSAD